MPFVRQRELETIERQLLVGRENSMMPNNSQFVNRAIRSQNQAGLHMRPPLQDYSTWIQSPNTPLHLRISSRPEGVEIMNIERRDNDDTMSQISHLEMGSIKMNPKYNPAMDPTFAQFIPPVEITIRVHEPIAMPALRSPPASVIMDRRQPSNRNPRAELMRHASCPTQTEYRDVIIEKVHALSIYGSEGQSSYYTSPTVDILSDGSTQSLLLGKGRKGLVRREINHMLGKVRQFKKTDGTRPRGPFRVQSTSGCLA